MILGRPLAVREEEEHKAGVLTGIPMLGLDALASCAYGPEAALTILLPLGALGIFYIGPIIGVILAILAILCFSYRQTIPAYPNGGGSYTVAKENLGVRLGLLAAASLLVDYVLDVAVAISAGVGALVSAVPGLQHHTLGLCLGILALIAVVNLRGIKESGVAFALPTYLFVGSLMAVIAIGALHTWQSGGHPQPVVPPPHLPKPAEPVSLWLLMRAFASGCTAMTGVEAVSNGVTAFSEPATRKAERTLTAIVIILGILLAGIAFLCHAYHVGATNPTSPGYQSIISQVAGAVVGRGTFYYITIGSVLAVLAFSANTGFADFPRLCRLLAEDGFLPKFFADRGRRLVYSVGIVALAVFAAILLIAFGGITDRLIPLFAVGAFGAFTLSQSGMVVHWRRTGGRHAKSSLAINATGAVATGVALVIILVAKFMEGAWITILIIPVLIVAFERIKSHGAHVEAVAGLAGPLDISDLRPPIVVVPMGRWDRAEEVAMRFAMAISPDVIGLHFTIEEKAEEHLRQAWSKNVEEPARKAGKSVPRLSIIDSPYRRIVEPLVRYIEHLDAASSGRTIAVIIPETVERNWLANLLRRQRATRFKMAPFFAGKRNIAVIDIPFYIGEKPAPDR